MDSASTSTKTSASVGEMLRGWRQRRRLSQLEVALEAEVSTRHISFLETGRSLPSRQMLLRLAEHLDIPLRERNTLLVAAGYAPLFSATPLDDPSMEVVRQAIDQVLAGHEPFPALAVDRHWTLVAANRAVDLLLAGVAPSLLRPPLNVLRLGLHPQGLAPRVVNLAEWRHHILARLQRQVDLTADPALTELLGELRAYPLAEPRTITTGRPDVSEPPALVIPLRLRTPAGLLSLISTTTIFGTAVDITLSELTIESFFPADSTTATILSKASVAMAPS